MQRLTRHLEPLVPLALEVELPDGRGKLQKHACGLKWQEFEVEANRRSVVMLRSLTDPQTEWGLLTDQPVSSRPCTS